MAETIPGRVAPTSGHDALSHSQAVYVDECERLLMFIADARRREDAAYALWETPSATPRQRDDAREDYLRAYDEVDWLRDRLARLQRRHADAHSSGE
jgi:hypothetical protein